MAQAKHQPRISRACFVGAGLVGSLSAIVLARKNPRLMVDVVDRDVSLIQSWISSVHDSQKLPIQERGLEDLLYSFSCPSLATENLHGQKEESRDRALPRMQLPNLHFSADIAAKIRGAQMIFLCVDTPSSHSRRDDSTAGRNYNIASLAQVIETIAEVSKGHKIVVDKSTVPLGTANTLQILLSTSSQYGASFSVLSNPEFLAEGNAVHDLLHPDRVVIGWLPMSTEQSQYQVQPPSATALIKLYSSYVPRRKIISMDAWSSELGKLASNALLAQQIVSIGTISSICEASKSPCSAREISKVISTDSRLGGGALEAGFGVGGPCLEKDLRYLIYLTHSLGLKDVATYWQAVIDMNKAYQTRIVDRIMGAIRLPLTPSTTNGELKQSKIAVLGLGFKKSTPDTRGSIVISMIKSFTA